MNDRTITFSLGDQTEQIIRNTLMQVYDALKEKGVLLKPRFSAGYGDLPLAVQKAIFSALELSQRIGLTLNESLLMTPSKSVTAIFGLGSCLGEKTEHKCSNCAKTDCEYRNK